MLFRRSFVCLAVTALALVALLISADPASAQRWRAGRSSGYNPGYGYGDAYGGAYGPRDNYSGWGYSGSGWNTPGYRGAYPGYSGYTGNTPQYQWSENQWSRNQSPSYYSQGMAPDYYSSSFGSGYGESAYGSMSGGVTDNQALINVRVPPNSEVWFDDQKTSQTGSVRTFVTPSLNQDRNAVYHIKARWTENGRTVEKTRRYDVHPGDRIFVSFFNPRSQNTMETSGQYGIEPAMRSQDRSLEHRDRTLENRDRNNADQNADRALENRNEPRNQNPTTPRDNTTRPPEKP